MQTALLILPDFSLILLGALLRRGAWFGDALWEGLEKLNFYVLFPALLFVSLIKAPIDFTVAAPLFTTGLIAMAAGMLLAAPAKAMFALTPLAFASRFQCAFRFNTYIGIAVAGKLYGEPGIVVMGVLCGVMVPFSNVASVWMLARQGSFNVARELAHNPIIIATVLGIALNIAQVSVPLPAQQFLGRLADATIAMGLLTVGAALRWRRPVRKLAPEVYFLAVKLLAMPLAAWFVGRLMGLNGIYFNIAVLFAALPTASSAYVLTVRMGGDGPGVAWLISVGTLVGMMTLPLWIGFLA